MADDSHSNRDSIHNMVIVLSDPSPGGRSDAHDGSPTGDVASDIAAAFGVEQVLHTTSPARVMLALAGGVKTVLLAGPPSDFSNSDEIGELIAAVTGYHEQAVVLQWHKRPNAQGEAGPVTDAAPTPSEMDDVTGHVSRVESNEETSPPSSSRSLITKEELAMLMQPLEIDPIPPTIDTQVSTGQASGEEGNDAH